MKGLAGLAFCLLAAVVSVAQMPLEQDLQQAVSDSNQAWMDGMKRGDSAVLSAAYAEGAMNCSMTGECVAGRAAIEQQFRMRAASLGPAQTATITSTSAVRDRDLAYEWGFVEVRFRDGQLLRGRYLNVWQRQPQTGWKIYRHLALPGFRPPREVAGPAAEPYVLRCESGDMGYHTCAGRGEIDRADVSRQISSAACIQDRTFGWKANALWVNRGCRAEFMVYPYVAAYTSAAEEYRPPSTMNVKCESENMAYRFCRVDRPVRRARLVRQISGSPCEETRTWGWKSDGIWVNKGCRAEFELMLQ